MDVVARVVERVAEHRSRPEDDGGEPACWLRRVCPACGGLAEEDPPTRCPRCGERIEEA